MKFTVSPSPSRPEPITPHSRLYELYMRSDAWKVKRAQVIIRAHNSCEHCGAENTTLQVHHRHYRTLGRERLNDLVALCPSCHGVADDLRKQWSRKR